jgi:hypothetical protein
LMKKALVIKFVIIEAESILIKPCEKAPAMPKPFQLKSALGLSLNDRGSFRR